MKVRNLLVAFGAGVAFHASADVSVTTEAPAQKIFPKAYGKVQVRHYTEREDGNIDPTLQARYYLGSKFFNDNLDSYFVFGVNKKAGNTQVTERETRIINEYSLVSNDNFNVVPYATVFLPGAEGSRIETAMFLEAKQEFSVPTGSLTLSAYSDAAAVYGSRAKETVVTSPETDGPVNADSIALAAAKNEDGELTATQQSPDFVTEHSARVIYRSDALSSLGLIAGVLHNNTYRPITEYDSSTGEISEKQSGPLNQASYTSEHELSYRIGAMLALSDTVMLKNDFYLRPEGKDGSRNYLNLITLSATLF